MTNAADLASLKDQIAQADKRDTSLPLVIEEQGPSPIRVELSGSLAPLVGDTKFGGTTKGGKYVPFGQVIAIVTAIGDDLKDTEFSFQIDGQFIRKGDIVVSGADEVLTPEGIEKLFTRIRQRARIVRVEIGEFARLGILRETSFNPTTTYFVQPVQGGLSSVPGLNGELTLRFEWQSLTTAVGVVREAETGDDVAATLTDIDSGLASSIADASVFDAGFFESISNGVASLRASISGLRRTLRGVGDLARAPAKAVNDINAAARSLGNLSNDFRETLNGVGDEYKAAGSGAADLLRARRASGQANAANDAAAAAVTSVLDAIAKRKARLVGVHPGDNLARVAEKELGKAERWPELAAHNEIAGQLVPRGVFTIEIPAGG